MPGNCHGQSGKGYPAVISERLPFPVPTARKDMCTEMLGNVRISPPRSMTERICHPQGRCVLFLERSAETVWNARFVPLFVSSSAGLPRWNGSKRSAEYTALISPSSSEIDLGAKKLVDSASGPPRNPLRWRMTRPWRSARQAA